MHACFVRKIDAEPLAGGKADPWTSVGSDESAAAGSNPVASAVPSKSRRETIWLMAASLSA
jgi:hypothetical protein